MEEKILYLLGHQGYSSESLKERLQISQVELDCYLDNLRAKKLIYLDSSNKYRKVQNGQIIGRLDSDSKGKKFVRFNHDKIFIKPEFLHTALKNDIIVLDIYENNKGIVLGIIERKNNRLVCEVIKKNGKLHLTPFNVGCEVSISISDKNVLKDFVEGDRVVVDLENKKATLIHNGSVAVKTAIETIESAGYSAKLID